MDRARSLGSVCAGALLAGLLPSIGLAYSDRAGTDIVMDAPWRSVRDEIPVLFFFPQFEGGRRIERIRIVERIASGDRTVFVDAADGADTLNGATIVGALGERRGGLDSGERIGSFWHYVVRLPHASLAFHGTPDLHALSAEVDWSAPGIFGRRAFRNSRELRVLADTSRFPRLDPRDLDLDTHVHTIAEQSTSGTLDANGAVKAYGGPIVMLLESAWALGLVDSRPGDGNWTAFRDQIAITDHNIFYSRPPYDTGVAPPWGPTAGTDGHAGEAAWYREHLGRLAGEEVTLRRGSGQDDSPTPNLGHHLLVYGAPHFEGPWHGGKFLTSNLENPNTLESVLARIKAAGGQGFVYASHPRLSGFVWPPEYEDQGAGFPPYHSRSGEGVDEARGAFLFRGYEVWNIKMDRVSRDSGRLPASRAFDAMNPFPGGPASQRFRNVAWDGELMESLDALFALIGRGLRYAFRETPGDRFIRKLYLSAGSDAHGDFNYSDEVTATAVPWSGWLHSNAFARVRTSVLVHDRTDGADAVEAFRDGNTVITDGPLLTWRLDGDGRHDPGAGAALWHDAESRWENGDGRLGGAGRFDGGRTLLVVAPGGDAWIRSEWRKSVSPEAGDITRIVFDRVKTSGRDSFTIAAGPAGAPEARPLPVPLDSLCALIATARDLQSDERCITNPIWVAPVEVTIAASPLSPPPGVAFPAGSLRISFRFPFSMSPDTAMRVSLRPLDGRGISAEPAVALVPAPGWEDSDGVRHCRYTVTTAADVPLPAEGWDATSHRPSSEVRSFVVSLTSPADVHGNRLNDIARAFTCPLPDSGASTRRSP